MTSGIPNGIRILRARKNRIKRCPVCGGEVFHMDFSDGYLRQFCRNTACDFEENFTRFGDFSPTYSRTPRTFPPKVAS